MLDVTDRHFRVFARLLSRRAKLYTEMVVGNAILHGGEAARARFLDFGEGERPLALQLGGAVAEDLAECARLAVTTGGGGRVDEINLNVGCPSSRVQSAEFGACLMAKPGLVGRCVGAMREAVGEGVAITVKTRIGIDGEDSYGFLRDFVGRVAEGGCGHFIIHARKALLRGLSPRQNRNVPPLDYGRVYRLKRDFPQLRVTINGGIGSLAEAAEHLRYVDGVMLGRAVRNAPWLLRGVDGVFGGEGEGGRDRFRTRAEVARAYGEYVEGELGRGVGLRVLLKPLFGLYHGEAGARSWRRALGEGEGRKGGGAGVIEGALEAVGGYKEAEGAGGAEAAARVRAERERRCAPRASKLSAASQV